MKKNNNILILDTSYTLSMIKERQLEQALESRKLGSYFSKVISVHPLAGLLKTGDEVFGEPNMVHLDEDHIFIEGKVSEYKTLRYFVPLNFFLAQYKLLRLLLMLSKKYNINVIRIGDPYYLGLIGLILSRLLRIPLVIRVGFRYDEIVKATGKPVMKRFFKYRWIEKIVERFVFKRCNLIAGANEDNMLYAIENGGRADRATVFRYGNLIHPLHWIEPADRNSEESFNKEIDLKSQNFCITIARLEKVKYVKDALLAFSEIIKRGHEVNWILVGDGILRQELEDLAFDLNVRDYVFFAGNRNQEWLSFVLPRAKVVISPHMGRALTEAALAGVPIVAYDYDWQREVVVDAETGYLVKHRNWMALADKVEIILNNPESRIIMGKNVRIKILNMMNPVKLVWHEKNEYSKLLLS